ncbi:hypothetical protein FACS1894200_09310 [Spirochaetia bacterium]|nr:hypothetical protein FACS1894200_09310 [Spirochaetia bacterium]
MVVMNGAVAEQVKRDADGRILFESEEEFDTYSRNLLGVDEETYALLLAEAEAELRAESGI